MERQEATKLSGIRPDHILRYKLAAKIIKAKNLTNLVIDVACGVGYGSYILADYTKNVIAIDKNTHAIKKAKKYFFKKNITFLNIDAFEYNYKNCDLIVCYEFLEHIKDDKKLIKLFSKKSKKLIISTPNELIRPYNKNPVNPYHVRHYTPKELQELLENFGYKIYKWYSQKSGNDFNLQNGTNGKFIIAYCKKDN